MIVEAKKCYNPPFASHRTGKAGCLVKFKFRGLRTGIASGVSQEGRGWMVQTSENLGF